MKRINIMTPFMALLMSIFIVSCSEDIMDRIDTNPNDPTDVSLNLILPAVQTHLAYAAIGGDMSLYASVWSQLTTGVHAQLHEADRYVYSNALVNNTWNSIYLNVLRNTENIINKAEEEDFPAYKGIGLILKAYTIGMTTDTWGRVPFTEALQGTDVLKPKFDTQESIYTNSQTGIFAMLDEAINILQNTAIGPGNADLIYNGNLSNWIKAAHSLKAHFMTRLSNTTYYDANVVINAAANGFASAADGFIFNKFTTAGTGSHPWWQEFTDRTHFAISESLFERMVDKNDPRVDVLFEDGANSIPAPNGAAELDQAGNIYTKIYSYVSPTSPLEFMTYDQLQFKLAEAHLRQGNGAEASLAYENGVRAALTRTGVATAEIDAFLAQGSVSPGPGGLTLEHVWEQNYHSLYPFQSIEAFAEVRRTNYPVLTNPNGEMPRRFPYPQGEIDTNGENVPNVQLYPGPGVWWDDGTED